MKNLTVNDATQMGILPHLSTTELLLARAASKASGREQGAEIWAMPDLGFPHNVRRIHGGFFTGALYTWQSSVPIVPIDATVNICGVSVYQVNREIASEDDFVRIVSHAQRVTEDKSSYVWNYADGHHFIMYAKADAASEIEPGYYLVLHSSACEFKNQHNGLYPFLGNWYYPYIEVVEGDEGRYLRYIKGGVAERFIHIAQMLVEFNRIRHHYFAELIIGAKHIVRELFSLQHYGMPTHNSIAVGCHFLDPGQTLYMLLSRPKRPLYFVRPSIGGPNMCYLEGKQKILTPHGLGVASKEPINLTFNTEELLINGRALPLNSSLRDASFLEIRDLGNNIRNSSLLQGILNVCPGEVVAELKPLYSYHRSSAN